MGPSSWTPHDRLFKEIFGRRREAKALLRTALPASVVAQIDLRTLRPVRGRLMDAAFRERPTDLLFTARRRGRAPALIYLLFEHKSTLERLLPLQLLIYVARILDAWARTHRGGALPFVIPVVLYHGERPMPEIVGLHDLLDTDADGAPLLVPWMPSYRVPVFDLNRVDVAELVEHVGPLSPLGAAALALMKTIRGTELGGVCGLSPRPCDGCSSHRAARTCSRSCYAMSRSRRGIRRRSRRSERSWRTRSTRSPRRS
jgi:hypothetical protein